MVASMATEAAPGPLVARLLEALSQDDIDVPMLPAVATEVMALTLDEQASTERLVDLIARDQSLTAHLLRVVNSPIYRGTNEIVALQQALTRLGMQRVRQIAVALALGGAVLRTDRYSDLADACWQQALLTALWSKEVARACKRNVELAYLCGLLHNVGSSLVLQLLSREATPPEVADVRTVLDSTVAAAGVLLGDHWALPRPICEVLAALNGSHEGDTPPLLAVTRCARTLAGWQLQGTLTADRLPELIAEPGTQELNLYPEDLLVLLEMDSDIAAAQEALS